MDNKIKYIYPESFIGLENLESLSMFSNELRALESGTFDNLKKLKNLDLSFNKLILLTDGVFDGLDNLEALHLWGNMFTTLRSSPFANFPRPLRLVVGYNPLQCDPRLCWLHQEEIAGNIKWPNVFIEEEMHIHTYKPNCSDGTDWDKIQWNCKNGKLFTQGITVLFL